MTDAESVPVTNEAMVVVAEDQPIARAFIVAVLQDADFEVLEVSSADEAFELLQVRDGIDALLTDVEMPGKMDGLVLAGLVRRRWPHLAIVVMSGKPLPVGHALPDRCCFHAKPCNVSALLGELRELLTISRPLRHGPH